MVLPITRVVLYKHGVGCFERRGPVTGTCSVDLHFKASEMNDVLKSLTTLDLGSGRISSISYESVKPVERQLEDVAVRLGDSDAVSGLLNQVKGARVSVEIGGKTVEGTVLGIEHTTRKEGDTLVYVPRLALLVGGASVQSFELTELKGITLGDEALRKDLAHLLDILIASKKKDLKRLTIFAHGEGTRDLAATYIIETPVWKTSYRLLCTSGEEKPLLQGWALVDNTQDEDWEDVRLTLVAGLPISFVHDLYAPRYKRRPVVEVKEEAAYAPPMLESAVEMLDDEPSYGAAGFGPPGMAPPPRPAAPPAMAAPAPISGAMIRQRAIASAPVQTRTVEVGDLFQYEIENPVTVRRGQSALVPILQAEIKGRRVAVYNPDVRAKNPMSAVLLTNTSGATLEGGPLTVMEDASYVGEAMLDTLKPGEERLVPFSVELGCVITVDPASEITNVMHSRIGSGFLYLTRYRVERRVYVVTVKGERPLELFLDHRFTPGWELLESETGQKPVERTDSFYRFRIEAPGGKTTRFVVVERGEQTETRALTQTGRDDLSVWLTNRWIDEQARLVLGSLIDLREQTNELARKIQQREQSIADIFQNQERLRQNLAALGSTQDERGLRERYVGEMSQEEDRLKELREEVRRDKTLKESLEHDLRARLATLTFQSVV